MKKQKTLKRPTNYFFEKYAPAFKITRRQVDYHDFLAPRRDVSNSFSREIQQTLSDLRFLQCEQAVHNLKDICSISSCEKTCTKFPFGNFGFVGRRFKSMVPMSCTVWKKPPTWMGQIDWNGTDWPRLLDSLSFF